MICSRCVLDSTLGEIHFDEYGICNYCRDYCKKKDSILKNRAELDKLIVRLSSGGAGYSCIVGVSGGLDSSFLLYKAVQLGLRPLAVHIDTGWNTNVSTENIKAVTERLKVDLKTFVLEWEQFKQIQIAYLKAGVIDIEFPTDHYYLSGLYKMASDLNIKYILTGNNYASEGIMPACWIHNKGDTINMLDIYERFGNKSSLNKLPTMTLSKRFYYYNIKKIENIFMLNYLDYNREQAKNILINSLGWKEHPVKHGESIFTRFYQRYILPRRFKIDYRKAHLSSLICNSQITRSSALECLTSDITESDFLEQDKLYVLKKLGLSESDFDSLMSMTIRSHTDFRSEIAIKKTYNKLIATFRLNRFLKISNRH